MRVLRAILSAGLLAGLLTGCFSYSSHEDEWRGRPNYYGNGYYSGGYYGSGYDNGYRDDGYYYNRGGSCWNCGRY
jgi:hypothetical protein